ncbi:GNAT family N-acetyltransferase [Thalassobacillus hwangdonensis]|uniref:GNAT family N-acetyltransferase n=1 Tax=Thalassobacillus hwangdonensis TaxID=546108 RepID=A0ABW3L1M1_9BACI
METTIRKPENKDLLGFTRCAIDYLQFMTGGAGTEALRERKYWAADRLMDESDQQLLLVAEVDGKVIGYIYGIAEADTNVAQLLEMEVDAIYRGEGIGRKLFAQALREWKNQGVDRLIAECKSPYLETLGFSNHSFEMKNA